jgi:hypothetical protein
MARKPFKGNVAANVLAFGTGAINVDACRIGLKPGGQKGEGGRLEHRPNSTEHEGWGMTLSGNNNDGKGRWPANVILDEAAADVLDKQSGVSRSSTAGVKPRSGETNIYGGNALLSSKTKHSGTMEYGDTGGASRFFYVAKASRRERNAGLEGMPERAAHELTDARISTASNRRCATCGRVKFGQPHCECAEPQWEETTGSKGGNFHPTVKPLALMRYLIQMVTPPEGIVLDPFMGSGSTLVAAAELGFPAIGIELSEEYAEIAARRVNHALDERAGYLPGMEVLG